MSKSLDPYGYANLTGGTTRDTETCDPARLPAPVPRLHGDGDLKSEKVCVEKNTILYWTG
jgi:hypothetical protein